MRLLLRGLRRTMGLRRRGATGRGVLVVEEAAGSGEDSEGMDSEVEIEVDVEEIEVDVGSVVEEVSLRLR